jgi:L-asparaginase
MSDKRLQKILVLATGGTIVCADSGGGLRPHYTVEDLLASLPALLPAYQVVGKGVMSIDSSNMTPQHWLRIAAAIGAYYDEYDGFVITHGTDTMAYTSAALTYLLQGLNKPVVLTGAQLPVADAKTDAIQNLGDSLLIAAEPLAGVFVVFDGKVINGSRAIKTKTRSYDAFESVNYPLVAEIKHNRINYCRDKKQVFSQSSCTKPLLVATKLEERLLIIKLFPGLQPAIFDFIRSTLRGVIIESYGTGGIQTEIMDLAAKVRELAESGIVVAITTQCLKEGVDLQIYEVGRKLPLDKIVYGRDMTTEALVAKLMWAMGQTSHFRNIKEMVEMPVRDDLLLADEEQS